MKVDRHSEDDAVGRQHLLEQQRSVVVFAAPAGLEAAPAAFAGLDIFAGDAVELDLGPLGLSRAQGLAQHSHGVARDSRAA